MTLATGCNENCEQDALNERFYRTVKRWYLWRDHVPDIDPKSYATSQEMIDAIRHHEDGELVDRWSMVLDRQALADYFQESESFGFGFYAEVDENGDLRVAYTDPGGGAEQAGLVRGDTLLGIGGESLETISEQDLWADVFGPDEEGIAVPFELRDREGNTREVNIVKGTSVLRTVSAWKVIERGDQRVGYVHCSGFVEQTIDELEKAFTKLEDERIDSLVVDVRYNGGGLASSAQYLASVIVPHEFESELLVELAYNDELSRHDFRVELSKEAASVQVRDVVFISGSGTASASEVVMQGLDSYVNVTQVGETTAGKPVAANVFESCDLSLNLITARLTYPQGPGEYYEGLEPDCAVPDDYDHALGDQEEARLAAALAVLDSGDCPNLDGSIPFGFAPTSTRPPTALRPPASRPAVLRPIIIPWTQNDIDILFAE